MFLAICHQQDTSRWKSKLIIRACLGEVLSRDIDIVVSFGGGEAELVGADADCGTVQSVPFVDGGGAVACEVDYEEVVVG